MEVLSSRILRFLVWPQHDFSCPRIKPSKKRISSQIGKFYMSYTTLYSVYTNLLLIGEVVWIQPWKCQQLQLKSLNRLKFFTASCSWNLPQGARDNLVQAMFWILKSSNCLCFLHVFSPDRGPYFPIFSRQRQEPQTDWLFIGPFLIGLHLIGFFAVVFGTFSVDGLHFTLTCVLNLYSWNTEKWRLLMNKNLYIPYWTLNLADFFLGKSYYQPRINPAHW